LKEGPAAADVGGDDRLVTCSHMASCVILGEAGLDGLNDLIEDTSKGVSEWRWEEEGGAYAGNGCVVTWLLKRLTEP
jgi:hypothetical protein